MTYQEKLKFAEDVAVELKKGAPIVKIEEELRSKGLYNLDVDKVMFSAKNIIEEEFGPKIKKYMLEGTLEKNAPEFGILDISTFENIKERIKRIILEETNKKVKELAAGDMSDEGIIKETISPCVSENEIRVQIENYRQYIETPKGVDKNEYLVIAVSTLVLGITMYILFYGVVNELANLLIGFGLVNLYKAYTPKGFIRSHK